MIVGAVRTGVKVPELAVPVAPVVAEGEPSPPLEEPDPEDGEPAPPAGEASVPDEDDAAVGSSVLVAAGAPAEPDADDDAETAPDVEPQPAMTTVTATATRTCLHRIACLSPRPRGAATGLAWHEPSPHSMVMFAGNDLGRSGPSTR